MATVAERLLEKCGPLPPQSTVGKLFRKEGPRDTAELQRVLALPRRSWEIGIGGRFGTSEQLASLMTEAFKREGGTQTLRLVQGCAIAELHDFRGLFGAMRVGSGKTLVTFLAPKAVDAKRPLLLIPAKLREKTFREWRDAQMNWVLPPIRIESYEMLSTVRNANLLQDYAPDLIIADEGHRLKNPRAAVTKRVRRYLEENQDCRFAVLSGTITKRTLHEYWHLLRWALGDRNMPLPNRWDEMALWSEALDVGADGCAVGALRMLADGSDDLDKVREGFRKRLTETPGVISTTTAQEDCSLSISQVDLELDHLAPYFSQLREWETPDGHPFSEAVDLWRHARELVCGFFYRWEPRPPEPWLEARRNWSKFVRETLKHSRKYDTELQVSLAVSKGELSAVTEVLGQEVDVYQAWKAVRDTFKPNSVPVWISDTVLEYARKWLEEGPGIVWCEHRAFGQRLEELSGRPYYGEGGLTSDGRSILDEKGPCSASILANGEGQNLQHYNRNLVVSCPPNGGVWEQLLGRTHRSGQTADEVSYEIILGCKEAFKGFQQALKDAKYIQDTTGQEQKLLYADTTIRGEGFGPLWG